MSAPVENVLDERMAIGQKQSSRCLLQCGHLQLTALVFVEQDAEPKPR